MFEKFLTIKHLYLRLSFKLWPTNRLKKSGARVGKNVFFGEATYIELENAKLLEIGDGAVLSAFTKIILHDSCLNNVNGFDILYGKVIIGKNVYIGVSTIVLPGTKIGDNTIIGAGSLVKGILRKDSVYAGSPARYLGTVAELQIKWKGRKNKLIFLKRSTKWYEKT